jgi:hypothetical protein
MTLTFDDPVERIKSIHSVNWTSGNTSGLTPDFDEMREMVTKDAKYQIIFYRRSPSDINVIGRGSHFDEGRMVTVEIRVRSVQGNKATAETIFNQFYTESKRICGSDAVRLNPGGSWDYLEWLDDNDQSYRANGFFRILMDYQLWRYGVSKT